MAGNNLADGSERNEIVYDGVAYSVNDTLVTCERVLPDSFKRSDKVKNMVIQDGVQRINRIAGKNDTNDIIINEVHIPASVKEIGDSAFYYCNPKYIKVEWFEPHKVKLGIKSLETKEKKNTTILLIPYGTKEKYKKAKQWKSLEFKEYPLGSLCDNMKESIYETFNQKISRCKNAKEGLGNKKTYEEIKRKAKEEDKRWYNSRKGERYRRNASYRRCLFY